LQEFAIEGNLKTIGIGRICNCQNFEICRDLQFRELWELGNFAIAGILRFLGICNGENFSNGENVMETLQLQEF